MSEEIYCYIEGCFEKATFEVEGNSVCNEHLVKFFQSTSLDIRKIGLGGYKPSPYGQKTLPESEIIPQKPERSVSERE